jgi:hypothetical protein
VLVEYDGKNDGWFFVHDGLLLIPSFPPPELKRRGGGRKRAGREGLTTQIDWLWQKFLAEPSRLMFRCSVGRPGMINARKRETPKENKDDTRLGPDGDSASHFGSAARNGHATCQQRIPEIVGASRLSCKRL